MKKLLSLALALVLVLGLCACSNDGQPAGDDTPGQKVDPPSAPSDQNTGTVADANKDSDIYSWIPVEDTNLSGSVRFYVPFGGDQGMNDMIAEFNEMYPNITVELNTYSNNADGNIALNTAIMAGECDVVASFEIHNLMNRLNNGLYLDLTDRVAEENISLVDNWGTEAYNVGGKTYVFPCGGLTHYVAINMTAWEAAGLGSLPTAWTWDRAQRRRLHKGVRRIQLSGYYGSDGYGLSGQWLQPLLQCGRHLHF